jgi:hypothetical protein
MGLAEYVMYSPRPMPCFSAEEAKGDFDVGEDE